MMTDSALILLIIGTLCSELCFGFILKSHTRLGSVQRSISSSSLFNSYDNYNSNNLNDIYLPPDDLKMEREELMNNMNNNMDINNMIEIVSKKGDASSSGISSEKEGVAFPTNINGTDVRVGIIMARWNSDIINGLYKGVNESLTACGVKSSNTFTTYVPGAFELPVTAKLLAASKRVDVIICLGCLIKGDTMHFEYIADATAHGIMKVSVDSFIPCIFGVLTVLDKDQAIKRSTGEGNEGVHWGKSAVEMGLARMTAMGMGGRVLKSDDQKTDFVNFEEKKDGDGDEKEKEKAKPKKIGF